MFVAILGGILSIYFSGELLKDAIKLEKLEQLLRKKSNIVFDDKNFEYIKEDKVKENTVDVTTTKINTTNYYFDNMNNLHVNDKKYLIFNIYDACTINSTVQFNYKDETIEINLPSDDAALKLFKEISKKVK